MQCYTRQHKFYCGIDLHARKMYVCILLGKKVGTDSNSQIVSYEKERKEHSFRRSKDLSIDKERPYEC
jgi:hypothetical protein